MSSTPFFDIETENKQSFPIDRRWFHCEKKGKTHKTFCPTPSSRLSRDRPPTFDFSRKIPQLRRPRSSFWLFVGQTLCEI